MLKKEKITFDDPRLKDLSSEELKFLGNLARIYVQSIIKKADENSLSIYKEIKRRPI